MTKHEQDGTPSPEYSPAAGPAADSTVKHIPKIDLHVHIEGTIAPEIARMIADRNGAQLSGDLFDEDGNYQWQGFSEFIAKYDEVSKALKTQRDYKDITYHFLKKWASQGGIYAELIVSPNHADLIGLDRDEMMQGIYDGIQKAQDRFGITARINITCLRHESPEMAEEVANYAAQLNHPWVTGFNIAGGEQEGDVAAYKKAFDIAHNAGLSCTPHLAEAASAQQIHDALQNMPYMKRMGHGVNAIFDAKLLAELKNKDILLEVCPSSNVEIGIFPSMGEHPMGLLYRMGVPVSINTDDPPFFHTDIDKEYQIVKDEFGLTDYELCHISRMAAQHAFCEDSLKEELIRKIDDAEKKTLERDREARAQKKPKRGFFPKL